MGPHDPQMTAKDEKISIFASKENDWPHHAHQLAKFALCKALDELADQGLDADNFVVCFDMYILMAGPPFKVDTIRILEREEYVKRASSFGNDWVLIFPASSSEGPLKILVDAWINSWDE